jgi:dihydropteroate synthase
MGGSPPESGSIPGTGTPPAGGSLLEPARQAGPLWRLRDRALDTSVPVVMGIVNLTPDSFSDGGAWPTVAAALHAAERMVRDGADILDVGGESTRPGADAVPAPEELRRVLPFVTAAVEHFDVPISVDTRKAAVAEAALEAGAHGVNDVSGLRHDGRLARVVAQTGAGLTLMHMRGEPGTMARFARYRSVVEEVRSELAESVDRALAGGVERDRIVVDPGIGFAKTPAQSLELLAGLERLADLGFPLMVGPSRKSFLGAVLGLPPGERVEGTLAACVAAYVSGARVFRVHDVQAVIRALRVAHAIRHPEGVA